MAEENKNEAVDQVETAENQTNETQAEATETTEATAAEDSKEAAAEEAETPAAEAEAPAKTEETKEEAPAASADTGTNKPYVPANERYGNLQPLADFDWGGISNKANVYSESEQAEMEGKYNETLTSIAEHEVLDGTVVSKTKKEVVVNIGYKSEGVVPSTEFRYNPDLAAGDSVEVYVEQQEDRNGQLVLSHKKARILRAWTKVNEALETEEVIMGSIKCRTKGGLIADVFGIEAFLPGSQIDVKPIRDYDQYVGKQMEFKVVKINHEFKNVVVSHKALIEAELEAQKAQIISKLEKGQVLEGTVKNITSYGVFIDLGGVDGLVHITDLSWGRINHPEEVVELDQKLNVVILDFDDDKKRIALGLKQLTAHPWDALDDTLKIGDTIKGKVVVLADYGAFVEIQPGVEGLIHVSEMSWSQHLRSAQDFFKVGDEVEAVVMTLDREERKMSLSTRRLTPDPWEDIEKKYPVESRHTGKVTNLSNFGVFVELEEGIDGLIHISDLSWSKKISHPSEFTKAGNEIEVVVLEIDKDNRRLSLGHKQLEENPWEVFETVFTIGSVHQGTVLNKNDKGAVVSLPYGVEGYAPARHLQKEDGEKANNEEVLDFKVLEFNKNSRKILVSHLATWKAEEEKRKKAEGKRRDSENRAASRAVDQLNKQSEKMTIGSMVEDSALAALKAEMEASEKEAAKPAPKAKKEAEPKAEEPKAEEPKAEEAKAEEPKAEEAKAEEPTAEATEAAPAAEEAAEAPAEPEADTDDESKDKE